MGNGLAAVLLLAGCAQSAPAAPPPGVAAGPALVELYSSEGCSSCPPADAILSELDAADPSVVALELHVDYWNRLGWTDPFSSVDFSARQSRYADLLGLDDVFTPQIIVNGRKSVVGSNASALAEALARRGPVLPLEVTFAGGTLRIAGKGLPRGALWYAVAEAGLVTDVTAGENRGKRLRHGPVVRRLERLGAVEGELARSVLVKLDPAWRPDHLRLVAVLQDPNDGRVLALGTWPRR